MRYTKSVQQDHRFKIVHQQLPLLSNTHINLIEYSFSDGLKVGVVHRVQADGSGLILLSNLDRKVPKKTNKNRNLNRLSSHIHTHIHHRNCDKKENDGKHS